MSLELEAELMTEGKRSELLALCQKLREKIVDTVSIPELIRIQGELKKVLAILKQ